MYSWGHITYGYMRDHGESISFVIFQAIHIVHGKKNATLCDFNFQHVVCTQAQMANSGFILGLFLDGFFHLFFSVCSWWRLDFRTKHALFLEKAEHSFVILLFLPFSHSHLFHSFIKPCPFVSSYFPEHIKASCLFHPSSISYLAKLQ